MWTIIKTIVITSAFIWQFVIVYGTEAIAEETGDYSLATYEMLWLLLIFLIGESVIKENDK